MSRDRRHGQPYSLGYPKGFVSESVAAVPFSQYLEPDEELIILARPYFVQEDRRWNGRTICRRERPDD
jgi:hypothetical protein